ncbi:MAG: TraB/GumN family protein [Betaproteobacteria bacterium]
MSTARCVRACRIATLAAVASMAAEAGPLYRIERAGVAPSYLFGTLHSSDARVATLAPAVLDALARSKRLAPELVMGDGDLPNFVAGASYDERGGSPITSTRARSARSAPRSVPARPKRRHSLA